MQIRTATIDELDTIEGIFDGAMLETERERTRRSVEAGKTVVALEDGRLLGAAVAVPEEMGVRIDAIAVRPRRRGQGIGTALLEAVVEEHDRIVVEFDERVRPFYEAMGFEIARVESGDRFRGQYDREI